MSVAQLSEGRKLRVLFLSRKHPPSIGGMEKLSYELISSLRSLVDADVIAWGRSQRWLFLFLPYCLLLAIAKIVRRRPDVMHLGDPVMCLVGIPLKRLFRIPVAVTVHGLDITYDRSWYQRLIVPLLRECSHIVCISRQAQEECAKRVMTENVTVIPPGIDTHNLPSPTPEACRTVERVTNEADQGAEVLLTVGRLVKRKGVEHFIRNILPLVLAERSQVVYWVVGDGPERENIKRTVERADLDSHVYMWGQVSKQTLAAIYERADVVVMPNIAVAGDMEGFGLVALEANLAGVPVVASELEGIQDAITNGQNGVLISSNDIQGFARHVVEMLENEKERLAFAKTAKRIAVERFGWNTIAKEYESVLRMSSSS